MKNGENVGFGLIFDNLLGYDVSFLRRLLNLYAILYDKLVVSDSWLLTNDALQKILSARDGVEIIRSGIIIPAIRDTAGSFENLLKQVAEKKMHGVCATPNFAKFLDAEAHEIAPFVLKEIAASYSEMSQRVLEPEVLMRLGVSEMSANLVGKLNGEVAEKTNSFVKDTICPQLPDADAIIVMEAARAPYSLNLPSYLRTGIIGPENFRGDRILSALHGSRATGSLMVSDSDTADHNGVIRDAMANWLLSEDILGNLTAEDLSIARSISERAEYQLALSSFLAKPETSEWEVLFTALNGYLSKAGEEVFRIWLKGQRINSELKDGNILIEGSTTIKITPSGKTVELRGIEASTTTINVEEVKVIGREIGVPTADAENAC